MATARKIEINVQPREITGRASGSLRRAGMLPGVLYGNNFPSRNIQVPLKDFQKVYTEAGESTLVYLKLSDDSYPAIIHDVAVDPIRDHYLHVDFYKVRLDEKIKAKIAVEFAGEAPAVKDFGGILVRNINEIEVEGLPQDLPHNFTVDISVLKNIKDQLTVKDIKIPEGIELKANPDDILVLVQEPISEEQLKAELETAAPSTDDVEVIKKEAKEAEPAEDGAAPADSAKGSGEPKEAKK
ncbi:MAG: 50S ribosomal protein L25 [Patescibacteria group bacterium]